MIEKKNIQEKETHTKERDKNKYKLKNSFCVCAEKKEGKRRNQK